jgi:hypothetical protein
MSRQSSPAGLANEAATIGDRVVINTTTTGTTINLTPEAHAGRVYVLDTVLTVSTVNIKLPNATGSGDVYEIVNNAVQTFGFIVSLQKATDYMTGTAIMLEQAGGTDDVVFYTSDTSDKITFNATTTGGLRGDRVKAIDYKPGYYLVEVRCMTSGDTVTPFSAT